MAYKIPRKKKGNPEGYKAKHKFCPGKEGIRCLLWTTDGTPRAGCRHTFVPSQYLLPGKPTMLQMLATSAILTLL